MIDNLSRFAYGEDDVVEIYPADENVIEEEKAMAQSVGTIVIDTVENDDWMKTLPGYQDEVKIHEELAAKLGGKKKPKVRIPVTLEPVEQ